MRENTALPLCHATHGHSRMLMEGVLQQSPKQPDPRAKRGGHAQKIRDYKSQIDIRGGFATVLCGAGRRHPLIRESLAQIGISPLLHEKAP